MSTVLPQPEGPATMILAGCLKRILRGVTNLRLLVAGKVLLPSSSSWRLRLPILAALTLFLTTLAASFYAFGWCFGCSHDVTFDDGIVLFATCLA